jgi:AcrR family transcriptional regulator
MTHDALTKRRHKTRTAFLEAFVRLVMARGFDHITVTDIAAEADYGRWAFYQYFESKEAVVWAVFEHWMALLDQAVVQAVQGLVSPRREYESWRIIFRAFDAQKPFMLQLGHFLLSEWRVRIKEFLVAQFLGHLKSGQFALMPGVRPELAARLYVAALIELLEHWAAHPEIGDADALLAEFFTFIFNRPPPDPVEY